MRLWPIFCPYAIAVVFTNVRKLRVELCAFRGRVTSELQKISSDLSFSVFSSYFFHFILFFYFTASPQDFPFHQRNTINDDFHLLIQSLYLHLSHLTPQPRTLTADRCLRLRCFLINGDGDDDDWEKAKGSKGGDEPKCQELWLHKRLLLLTHNLEWRPSLIHYRSLAHTLYRN